MLTIFASIKKLWKPLCWVPLLAVLIAVPLIYKKEKTVFPFTDVKRSFNAYTDKTFERGFSDIDDSLFTDDSIKISYTFIDSNKALIPFAGLGLMDSLLEDSFNPFEYEKVRIRLKSKERQLGYFLMTFHLSDSSSFKDPSSYSYMQKAFSVFPNKTEYEFSLDDFIFPDWWLSRTSLTLEDIKKRKTDKLWHIFIDMNSNNKYINKNNITLYEVTFYKEYTTELILGVSIISLYYLFLWIICIISTQHEQMLAQKTKIELPYKTIEIIDTKLVDLKSIIDTIERLFTDVDFSITVLAAETTLAPDRISLLLQEHFNGATFKQYLNTVRIHAAEQLLKESDRKVQDIALSVGYANITHFNRMFKKITTYAPTLYRETFQQK